MKPRPVPFGPCTRGSIDMPSRAAAEGQVDSVRGSGQRGIRGGGHSRVRNGRPDCRAPHRGSPGPAPSRSRRAIRHSPAQSPQPPRPPQPPYRPPPSPGFTHEPHPPSASTGRRRVGALCRRAHRGPASRSSPEPRPHRRNAAASSTSRTPGTSRAAERSSPVIAAWATGARRKAATSAHVARCRQYSAPAPSGTARPRSAPAPCRTPCHPLADPERLRPRGTSPAGGAGIRAAGVRASATSPLQAQFAEAVEGVLVTVD